MDAQNTAAQRKPMQRELQTIVRAEVRPGRAVCVTPALRDRIENAAEQLWARGEFGDLNRTIARRERVEERIVDLVIAGLMLQHKRAAGSLRIAINNAAPFAEEAGAAIWEDVA